MKHTVLASLQNQMNQSSNEDRFYELACEIQDRQIEGNRMSDFEIHNSNERIHDLRTQIFSRKK